MYRSIAGKVISIEIEVCKQAKLSFTLNTSARTLQKLKWSSE